jgi:hypothetical protein
MNVEIGTEIYIPFLGIFVSKFRYFVFAVQAPTRFSVKMAALGIFEVSYWQDFQNYSVIS